MKSNNNKVFECLKKAKEKILVQPLYSSISVLMICVIVVALFTIFTANFEPEGILVEAYGMLMDIVIFGIFILLLDKAREKRQLIQRYKDEIDDLRYWPSDEAMFRIVGNIRRLNKLHFTRIDLYGCYLLNANLRKVNLYSANLCQAKLVKAFIVNSNLEGVDLNNADVRSAIVIDSNLKGAKLINANLSRADFTDTKLSGANLRQANLLFCQTLTCEQLSEVKTLYKTKLDEKLRNKIEEKYPHLLEEPKDEIS